MRYFIALDNMNNIIYLHSGNNFETILDNYIEISEEDYRTLEALNGKYKFKYENGKVVNTGEAIVETPLTAEEQKLEEIAAGVNLLVELQADLIGGAI